MPDFLFNSITKLDSSLADTWAEALFLKVVGSRKADRDDDDDEGGTLFVHSKRLRDLLDQYKPDEKQVASMKETLDLDYRLGYTRIPGITMQVLTEFYTKCPSSVKITWFTCKADIFFGPASVKRLAEQMEAAVETIVIKDASHSDIFLRTEVWQMMVERIMKE